MKNILVIGSGGREHSICMHLSKSEHIKQIFVLPGNAGTKAENKCQNLNLNYNFDEIVRWSTENDIALVVVGPEDPLIKGLSNKLQAEGIRCFGPRKNPAQLEGSKIFAKEIMKKCNIPTSNYECFTDKNLALDFLKKASDKMRVIKVDGIAAGKGVIVAKTLFEAETAVKELLDEKNPKFGMENSTVLIEEKMEGQEISVLAFTDGVHVRCFPPSQDHKRAYDNDSGPNTGGMGAFCPYDLVDIGTLKLIEKEIMQKVIDYMRQTGDVYQGILYAGLMLTDDGPQVLEFNCRFGDPETQVLLPQLKSDLFEVMMACSVEGGLRDVKVEFHSDRYSLCIVLASGGYPEAYQTGLPLTGLDKISDQVQIIHAGTRFDENSDSLLTSGGRVLSVLASCNKLEFCYNMAMAAISKIQFPNCHYRKDIGNSVLKKNYRKNFTYSGVGVNIDAADELVDHIKSISAGTERSGNVSEIGSFGALFDLKLCDFTDPLLVSGTDGVGTKLEICIQMNKHDTIGQDLVAMCVNDILCHGAEPLYFLDYFASGKLDLKVSTNVLNGITNACRAAGCSLIGGETAEMPGIYSNNYYDLAGFAVGAVERSKLLPKLENIKPGNHIIGLFSNGLHSNGFSLARKIVSSFSLNDVCPFGDGNNETLGISLLAPTTIYVKPILQLLRNKEFGNEIYSLSHITGGGLIGNLHRSLPSHMKASIDTSKWEIPPIFKWLWKLSSKDIIDFSKTFNLGIGMALVVSSDKSQQICDYLLQECAMQSRIIGEVLDCKYKTENRVILKNLESSIESNFNFCTNLKSKIKTKVAVLISGSGSNLEAILKYSNEISHCSYEVVVVISNVDGVKGLDIARMYGIPTEVISHKNFANRNLFDEQIHLVLSSEKYNCQLICLAGFMRILSKSFTDKWLGKIINIHPSLLPSFKGANAHQQVLKSGVTLSGATVHFVTENVDDGGIISQGSVPVLMGDDVHALSERIKTQVEHKIYPEALHRVANGDCFLNSNNRVQWN